MTKDTRVAKYTFLNFAEDVLKQAKTPLTYREIWEQGVELGLDKKLGSEGKTPWRSMSVILRRNIQGEDPLLCVTSEIPQTFWLYSRKEELKSEKLQKEIEKKDNDSQSKSNVYEEDLHKPLVYFLNKSKEFNLYCKTIDHTNSRKCEKGKNKWIHPDIVGVHYPFGFQKDTIDFLKAFSSNPYKLYSFELKVDLRFSNLREYYFQAVSNSSWANEGYLVTLYCSEDEEFISELWRLNDTFGIGVIKLDTEDLLSSKVLIPAKHKENLDFKTINKLAIENIDFQKFIESVNRNLNIKDFDHIVEKDYDEVLTPEEIEEHIKKHNII